MLTHARQSPEICSLRELESLIRMHGVILSRASVDGDGHFRISIHKDTPKTGIRFHHGHARDLPGAVTAAFEAMTRDVELVSR